MHSWRVAYSFFSVPKKQQDLLCLNCLSIVAENGLMCTRLKSGRLYAGLPLAAVVTSVLIDVLAYESPDS